MALLRLTLILAEDDPGMLGRLRTALAGSAAQIAVVRTGWEMLALLSGKQVDLVVSDLRQPEPSGIQALSLARRLGITVPFLLIVEGRDPGVQHRAQALGARVLLRPFSDDDLVASVEALTRDAR